jgi:hypothetical protein
MNNDQLNEGVDLARRVSEIDQALAAWEGAKSPLVPQHAEPWGGRTQMAQRESDLLDTEAWTRYRRASIDTLIARKRQLELQFAAL